MEKITIPYTYLIRHTSSGNLYHGSRTKVGCNPDEFLKDGGYITSSKIVKSIIKEQGLNSFEVVVIEIFSNVKEAVIAEELYHKTHDVASNVYYFNQHNAGNKFCASGKKTGPPSAEHRAKISSANKGKERSPEHRAKISNTLKGRKHTEEAKAKISKAGKGRKKTPEAIEKTASKNRGRKNSEETKAKISASKKGKYGGEKSWRFGKKGEDSPNYGMKHSDETKKKMSESSTGRKYPKETCPHCNKLFAINVSRRWHFDNCKMKE